MNKKKNNTTKKINSCLINYHLHGDNHIDIKNRSNLQRLLNVDKEKVFNINNCKYPWINSLYKTLVGNFWVPEKIDISKDMIQELSLDEWISFEYTISFLNSLDALQTFNLAWLNTYISLPEISFLITIHAFQEAIHTHSYTHIMYSLFPEKHHYIQTIFKKWEEDSMLKKRNYNISKMYSDFFTSPNHKTFFISLIGDLLLEGLYFINGFLFFYALHNKDKLKNIVDIIWLIHRDEDTHVFLFKKLIVSFIKEEGMPITIDEVHHLFKQAIKGELDWFIRCYSWCTSLEINVKDTEIFLKYLANDLLRDIGLPVLFPKIVEHNYHRLLLVSDTWSSANVRTNFFEGVPTSYNMSSNVKNWDKIFK